MNLVITRWSIYDEDVFYLRANFCILNLTNVLGWIIEYVFYKFDRFIK